MFLMSATRPFLFAFTLLPSLQAVRIIGGTCTHNARMCRTPTCLRGSCLEGNDCYVTKNLNHMSEDECKLALFQMTFDYGLMLDVVVTTVTEGFLPSGCSFELHWDPQYGPAISSAFYNRADTSVSCSGARFCECNFFSPATATDGVEITEDGVCSVNSTYVTAHADDYGLFASQTCPADKCGSCAD